MLAILYLLVLSASCPVEDFWSFGSYFAGVRTPTITNRCLSKPVSERSIRFDLAASKGLISIDNCAFLR